jgi:hypothetical protein
VFGVVGDVADAFLNGELDECSRGAIGNCIRTLARKSYRSLTRGVLVWINSSGSEQVLR